MAEKQYLFVPAKYLPVIEAERQAERERCAKFIEGQGEAIGHLTARFLADEIRKLPGTDGD